MSRFLRCDSCGKVTPENPTGKYLSSLGEDYSWLDMYAVHVEANEDSDHGCFCSWACLAAFATTRAMERETGSHWADEPQPARVSDACANCGSTDLGEGPRLQGVRTLGCNGCGALCRELEPTPRRDKESSTDG